MANCWFDHVHVISDDPSKIVEFYEKMFAARRVSIHDEGDGKAIAKLDLNGITILINQRKGDSAQIGLVHFGIGTDNLDEAVAGMKADGVEFTQDIKEIRSDFKISFLKAPENVLIEL